MLRLPARLPDPLVGLAPHRLRAFRLRLDQRPQAPRQPLAAARMQEDRVERRPEHVVLALIERAVADPHRASAGVAGEVVAGRLGQITAPVDPVHDLQGTVVVALELGDELDELVRLPVEVEVVQRLQRERRVANPRVAVIPVALPTRRFRQRCRQRRDRRPRRHVREPLDGQRRALDQRSQLVVGDPRVREPGVPEPSRLVESLVVPRRRSSAPARHRPSRARRRAALPPRARAALAPCPIRSRAACRCAGRSSGPLRTRRHDADRRSATTPPSRDRSRTPARTPARSRRCPRCTGRCGRACARRPNRRVAACAE